MRSATSPPSNVVLQYLRYVLAAAEKHSFRQAAVKLGVWESTISRSIRDLEDEIGVACQAPFWRENSYQVESTY